MNHVSSVITGKYLYACFMLLIFFTNNAPCLPLFLLFACILHDKAKSTSACPVHKQDSCWPTNNCNSYCMEPVGCAFPLKSCHGSETVKCLLSGHLLVKGDTWSLYRYTGSIVYITRCYGSMKRFRQAEIHSNNNNQEP